MHNIQAVLFDFDDTLQDREAAYRAYCAAFLGEFFPALPPEEKARRIDEMEAHIEGGYRKREEYFPEMIALWGWESHPPVELLCRHFNEHYGEHVALFPDAIPTIQALKEQGYLLGVVSNGPSVLQNKKLDTAGIRDLFDVVALSLIHILKPKKELVRVVRSPEGEISLDLTSRKPGRGAYVCHDPECLAKARKKKQLERAFQCKIPDEVYDCMEEEMRQN